MPWLAPHVERTCGGLPILDPALTAAPGLHVLGPLVELELEPAGRNLWGAMRAAERLTAAVAPPATLSAHEPRRWRPDHS